MVSAESDWLYAYSGDVLVGVYLPIEVVHRLLADLGSLRDRAKSGQWQREECVAELSRLLTEYAPKPQRLDRHSHATDGSDQPVLVSPQ
jgi:hypothetical protein